MTNLLPPQEKAKLLSQKRRKLVVILGITIIIPLGCFILILLSINFYILGEINSQKVLLEQAKKEYETPDFLTFKDIIEKSNKTLTQVDSFYQKNIYFSDLLKSISLLSRPKNVYFTSLSLTKDASQKVKVAISGFSGSRDDLLSFQKSIKENQNIENLYFSPESWISPENAKFYLTFNIK